MIKNIVILGGGFGGLQSALKTSKKIKELGLNKKYKVILIDRHEYHTFTPLLYEIATTSKETAEYQELKDLVTHNFKDLFKKKKIEIINQKVKHVDIKNKRVQLKDNKIDFDYLILALGSETNYFEVPSVKENALKLKTFDDAVSIRNKITFEVENSEKENINIIIGGGGSTGVELAGEIIKWTCQLEKDVSCKTNVMLIQGGSKILPGFKNKIVSKATRRLEKLGVKVITKTFIKEANEKEVIVNDEQKIPYDVFIWTAGVKATDITKDLPVKKDKTGRIEIVNNLECIPNNKELKVYDDIYSIGDISCLYNPETGDPTPSVARIAITQGKIAAHNIIESIKKKEGFTEKEMFKKYKYKKYPYIIPIGGKYAVAKIGPFVVSGFIAWIFKGIVELNYLISILPFFKAFKIWIKGLKVFIKNDRLG